MVTLEQVEKLREKANVSYHEAREALASTNGDILEAIIKLEKDKKIAPPGNGGFYSSQGHSRREQDRETKRSRPGWEESVGRDGSVTFAELAGRFLRWCGRLIDRGNRNSFVVKKDGVRIMTVPVTVLAVLLLFAFWIVLPLIILGLFFGYRYRFAGPDLGRENVNRALDTVARAANDLKKEVKGHGNVPGDDTDH